MGINCMGMEGMGIRKSILVISTDMADNINHAACLFSQTKQASRVHEWSFHV